MWRAEWLNYLATEWLFNLILLENLMSLKIYLAGPDVFLVNARQVGERKRLVCRDFGFEGLFPLDQDDSLAGDPAAIFRANYSLMRQADVGLFNLTPFRGPSADPGTVFELGLMFALGKPVYGYTSAPDNYWKRVNAALDPVVEKNDQRWDCDSYIVEDFDLIDNLMIVYAIQEAGGAITVVEERADENRPPA